MYSSGTTGISKGIVNTHYARSNFASMTALEFRIDITSISLVTTPMYTNATWMTMLPTFLVGGTLVVMPSFDPLKFLEIAQAERTTHTFMVPTQYYVILNHPDFDKYDVSSFKYMISAAAPLRQDTKREIVKRFGCGLMELYGLTEGIGSTLKPEDIHRKTTSVGSPVAGCDIRIIDNGGKELPRGEIGEIIGYSPLLMKEYYKQPEKTADAIWLDEMGRTYLKTGDLGKLDEDGFLYILDRKKDMIISGGINIYASDIEEIISKHPAVVDSAVIAPFPMTSGSRRPWHW